MKCQTRSTLGVVIGTINIIGFSITIIYIITVLCDFSGLSEEIKQQNNEVYLKSVTLLYILLVICVFAAIISGLLIVGILKRRHSLMKPWIYCAVAGIICHALRVVIGVIGGFASGLPFSAAFLSFALGLFILSLQCLIFFTIYKLYKEIRDVGDEHEHTSLNTGVDTGMNTGSDNPPTYAELETTGKFYN